MRTRRVRGPRVATGLILLLFGNVVFAQYEDDDQSRDYEEQDRRYLERYVPSEEGDSAEPAPSADPAAMREQYLLRADELIRDRNHRSASGEGYRVQTDDPRLAPRAALALLDGFRGYFAEFFKDLADLRDYDDQSRVFLFYSFFKYNQMLQADFRFTDQRPKGHYVASIDVITLHTDADARGDLADTLIHEAAHQLVDQQLFPDKRTAAPWLSEGLASYFGYTYRDREGRFQPGVVGGKSTPLLSGDKPSPVSQEATARLQLYKKAAKSKDQTDLLHRLVATRDPGRFYGTDPDLHYAASWVLIHYLLHGDGGVHADALMRYIALEDQDQVGPEVLYRELGIEREALREAVQRHAKKLKTK